MSSKNGAETPCKKRMVSMPRKMTRTFKSQKKPKQIGRAVWKMLPARSECDKHGVDRLAANPRLNAEPAAGHESAQNGRHVRAQHAKRGARKNREGNPVARSSMRVQQHRNQHEHVAKKNGEERLLPAHAAGNHSAGQQIRWNVHAHGDPKRGVIVGTPGAALRRDGSQVFVIKRASANSFRGEGTGVRVIH